VLKFKNKFGSLRVKLLFQERFLAALWQRCQRCIGSNERISTIVCCYFRSAAVKVMSLLTLSAAGTSVSPPLATAVLRRAAE
jgi:hypothetical protein